MKLETFKRRDARLEDRAGERGCIAVGVVMLAWFLLIVEYNQMTHFLQQAGWPPDPIFTSQTEH